MLFGPRRSGPSSLNFLCRKLPVTLKAGCEAYSITDREQLTFFPKTISINFLPDSPCPSTSPYYRSFRSYWIWGFHKGVSGGGRGREHCQKISSVLTEEDQGKQVTDCSQDSRCLPLCRQNGVSTVQGNARDLYSLIQNKIHFHADHGIQNRFHVCVARICTVFK